MITIAVGQARLAAAIVGQDRVRDHRRRRVAVVRVDHRLDAVGREHFESAGESRLRQRMGVHAEEQRPVDAAMLPIKADRLRDRQDVRLVESTSNAEPRWPEVPKSTRCDGIAGSGTSAK